jgi:hypothetical protein
MSFVYVIGAISPGPKGLSTVESIKIGVTGGGVHKRLATLQTGNHRKLKLLYALNTGREDWAYDFEKSLHQALSHSRLSGEWFNCENNKVFKHVSEIFRSRVTDATYDWQPTAFYCDGAI